MTTNPHLKLTKGDTHPTPGVKGGLPARFRLTGSYGGAASKFVLKQDRGEVGACTAPAPVWGAVLLRAAPANIMAKLCAWGSTNLVLTGGGGLSDGCETDQRGHTLMIMSQLRVWRRAF